MPERMAALARVWFASALVILALATALTSPAEAQRRRRDRDRDRQSESAGSLVIEGAPDGAEILIDEVAVGTAPLGAIPVEPGSHTVRVRMPGYTEHTDIVEVRAGRPTSIAVELLALSHVLSVTSEPPSAHVYVDGTFMGETPVEFDLLEGTHSVRISLRGWHPRRAPGRARRAPAGHRRRRGGSERVVRGADHLDRDRGRRGRDRGGDRGHRGDHQRLEHGRAGRRVLRADGRLHPGAAALVTDRSRARPPASARRRLDPGRART
jgi:hypothetical protein